MIKKALSHPEKWGLIARNVANAVDAPRPGWSETAILPPDSVDRLLDVAEETPYCSLIFTALYSGMRRGELLGQIWCGIDLLMATISITQSRQRLCGASPKVISERLGHSSIAITIDIYSHIIPGLQEEAVFRFEDGLKTRVNTKPVETLAD